MHCFLLSRTGACCFGREFYVPFQCRIKFLDSRRRKRPHPRVNPASLGPALNGTQIPGSGALVWNLPMTSPAPAVEGSQGLHIGSAICEGVYGRGVGGDERGAMRKESRIVPLDEFL